MANIINEVGEFLLSDANKDSSSMSSYDMYNSIQRRKPPRQSIPGDRMPETKPPEGYIQWLEPLLEKQKFKLKHVFIVLAIYLGLGTICFFLVMHDVKGEKTYGVVDALYLCVVTMTTVGYGDLAPASTLARLFACVYVFSGMAFVGICLGKAADYILEKQEILLVRAIHGHQKLGTSEIIKEVEAHKAEYKLLVSATLLVVLITVGTVFLCVVEDLRVADAFYCVCCTITTLGYGDESFSTTIGRTFAIYWILGSTLCLAQFFLCLAELYMENRQRSLVKWVLTRNLTTSDIEAADLDHDKVVSAAEFIVYTLREMGKITEEDIAVAMERFKRLDVDHSGTLTESDLLPIFSQSS